MNELLKPRILVMDKYPNSPFKIGDVLEPFHNPDGWWKEQTAPGGFLQTMKMVHKSDIDECPKIFRTLNWHEHRQPEEMPEYVFIHNRVYKIGMWSATGTNLVSSWPAILYPVAVNVTSSLIIEWYVTRHFSRPATQEDYEKQIDILS